MTDRRIYLTVVVILGGALLACVIAISLLAGFSKGIPDILQNLAVGSLTGLAGLLSKGPSDEPQNVNVVNQPTDPVPVDAGHVSLDLLGMLVVSFTGSLLAILTVRVLLGS